MTLIRFTTALLAAFSLTLFGARPVLAHEQGQALLAQTERDADAPPETVSGRVHVLVIDDPARGTSSRHVELQLDDGTLVPLRGAVTDTLHVGARATVSGRHNGKWLEVASAREVAGASSAAETKGNAQIEGSLAILHADDFAAGKSSFIYELHQPSGKVSRLRLGSLPAALAPGMRLRVAGHAEPDGESITPDHITVLAEATSSTETGMVAKAATANSVLVIMANFSNTVAPAFTSVQAQQVMTSDPDSVANFFREASYGGQVMNVTVTPSWVAMNLAQPASCGSTDWQMIGVSAEAAAKALGAAYDPAGYKFVVYLFPTVSACGWIGLAYIGNPHKAWINGTPSFHTSTIAHELGHNFGLLHAASLRCGSNAIGGSCTVSEYGDPFDTMGNQRAMHYNAMQKSKLAWIAPTSVTTHTGSSATYTLSPLEIAGGATYAIKIPTASFKRTYWIEFRQPIGFDSPLSAFPNNGAQIRVSTPFETLCPGCDSYSDDTELVDTTPATSAFTDATLTVGQTFSDPNYGISVTVLAASASALTVQVGTGSATPPAPIQTATTVKSSANPALAGSSVTFTATIAASTPTGTVQFTADGASIAGCAAVTVSASSTQGTAICGTSALKAGTHAIVASYSGNAVNAGSTSTTLSQVITTPIDGTNVALSSNGGTASASSIYGPGFAPWTAIDGRRSGASWGNNAGWADGTRGSYPDWLQVNFNGTKTIDHVVVYSVQDNFLDPVEPTDTMTGTRYVLTSFDVQAWNGSAWVTLASVRNNNLIKRTVSFATYSTTRIRVVVNSTPDGNWSRITELEAWSPAPSASFDYALSSNGATASASSVWGPSFAAWTVIDNHRSGAGWGNYAGWADGTIGAFPDWVQVNFNGTKTIDHVVVYSVQDDFLDPAEPTDAMTGTRFVLTTFDVQGWNGLGWITLANVSGNNLIKRTVWFPAYATSRLRINVTGTQDGKWSRITEIEAWGT